MQDVDANRKALDLIRRSRRFLLVGHERPDGDCLGSQAALAGVLHALGKEVAIVNPDPPEPQFRYLGEPVPLGHWTGFLPEHDVCVLLDFNVLHRTGPMADALASAPSKKVVVDHHPFHGGDGGPWWDAAYVDVTASATGILVYRIARELDVAPDRTIARAVFTSLVTDTGWFRYSNTDAETLAVAAELVGLGVAPADMFRAIHQRAAASEPAAMGRALERTSYHAGGRLAVVEVPLPPEGEPELSDSDGVLDVLRSVEAVEVVLLLRELPDGSVKLSARSKTAYDVNALARRFGGGGHAKAAGARIEGALAEVHRRLVAEAAAGFPST
jgi:phosphoesterase RecJ-like protein